MKDSEREKLKKNIKAARDGVSNAEQRLRGSLDAAERVLLDFGFKVDASVVLLQGQMMLAFRPKEGFRITFFDENANEITFKMANMETLILVPNVLEPLLFKLLETQRNKTLAINKATESVETFVRRAAERLAELAKEGT